MANRRSDSVHSAKIRNAYARLLKRKQRKLKASEGKSHNKANPPLKSRPPIFRLPTEIRLLIFSYVIKTKRTINVSPRCSWSAAPQFHFSVPLCEPRLAAVSRAVRSEALSIHYGQNKFLAWRYEEMRVFLRTLDQERRAMLRYVIPTAAPASIWSCRRILEHTEEYYGLKKGAAKGEWWDRKKGEGFVTSRLESETYGEERELEVPGRDKNMQLCHPGKSFGNVPTEW